MEPLHQCHMINPFISVAFPIVASWKKSSAKIHKCKYAFNASSSFDSATSPAQLFHPFSPDPQLPPRVCRAGVLWHQGSTQLPLNDVQVPVQTHARVPGHIRAPEKVPSSTELLQKSFLAILISCDLLMWLYGCIWLYVCIHNIIIPIYIYTYHIIPIYKTSSMYIYIYIYITGIYIINGSNIHQINIQPNPTSTPKPIIIQYYTRNIHIISYYNTSSIINYLKKKHLLQPSPIHHHPNPKVQSTATHQVYPSLICQTLSSCASSKRSKLCFSNSRCCIQCVCSCTTWAVAKVANQKTVKTAPCSMLKRLKWSRFSGWNGETAWISWDQAKSTCSVRNVSVFCGLDPRKSFLVGSIPTFWAKISKKKWVRAFDDHLISHPKKKTEQPITTTFLQEKQTNPWVFMDLNGLL